MIRYVFFVCFLLKLCFFLITFEYFSLLFFIILFNYFVSFFPWQGSLVDCTTSPAKFTTLPFCPVGKTKLTFDSIMKYQNPSVFRMSETCVTYYILWLVALFLTIWDYRCWNGRWERGLPSEWVYELQHCL